MVKDIVKHALQANETPHGSKTVGSIMKGRCVVGHITWMCGHKNCSFKHNEVPDHAASAVAKLLKEGVKGAKDG
jgi:hypothetical protein